MLRDILGHLGGIVKEIFNKEEIWILLLLLALSGAFLFILPGLNLWAIVRAILDFLLLTWWFWLFLLLLPPFKSLLLFWRQELFKRSMKYVLLELKVPRELKKTPKAMEQVLASLSALRNAPYSLEAKYLNGEVTRSFGFEIVSREGEIHFYVRVRDSQRNAVEAAFFSQYPNLDIVEVDDYAEKLPKTLGELYEQGLDIGGTELILSKEGAYPIRTYPAFEDVEEDRYIDPISSLIEVLSKAKRDDLIVVQILAAPAGGGWGEKFEDLLAELQEPLTKIVVNDDEEGTTREMPIGRSPGQVDLLEAVETNLSKPAFNTLIRLVGVGPKGSLDWRGLLSGIMGSFNQFNLLNMNSFDQNWVTSTSTSPWAWPHVFVNKRTEYRKHRMLTNFLNREVPLETDVGKLITSFVFNSNFNPKRFLLNTEGLATIFHPPTTFVLTAPHLSHVESRRTGPPAGMQIFGEEDEIERFK
ncbi:MAG: hypothetical protein AAB617_02510 [Patescibacteria group bacterium]